MRDLSQNPYHDIYHRPHLSTVEKALLMGDLLQDKLKDPRPDYDIFRDSLRDTGRELIEKLSPLPESLTVKMDALLERARNKETPVPYAQLERETAKLKSEIDNGTQALLAGILDIPRAKEKVFKQQDIERKMEEAGLAFTTSDSSFMGDLDALGALRHGKWEKLKESGYYFAKEMGEIVTQMKADERRAGWQSVFNYIAHGDPDSPGMAAPPRAQFKKRPAPKGAA